MQTENSTAALDDRLVSAVQPSQQEKNRLRSHLAAARFGGAVALMLNSARHRNLPLDMLRSMLIPPMTRNQMTLVEAGAQETGEATPVALVLWAKVSDKTHKRLCEMLDKPMLLAPSEWDGGENYWIIDAIGQERFVAPAIRSLREGVLKGKKLHFRGKDEQGVSVRTL